MSADLAELATAWTTHVGADTASRATGDEVVARYLEPQRRYHGVRHLVWVVRHSQALARDPALQVRDLGTVVAAAFYHDAVYEPAGVDNEARSGRLAERQLCDLGWSPARAATVAALVSETVAHRPSPSDAADAAVLCDADLAVLATDPADYETYVRGVRHEYAHVDDASWRSGRERFLAELVARPSIYTTLSARRLWEARARANVAAELATLR